MATAAAHAVGLGVAHTLPLLGLLQPAHAVRREGRGAPVSGPPRWEAAVRRGRSWARGWEDLGSQTVRGSGPEHGGHRA